MKMFIGKKEALSNNSTKYGYSLDGLCVKGVGGYRSANGTFVNTAVSTDASVITKEIVDITRVEKGNVVIIDAIPYSVFNIAEINTTTRRFQLMNLMTGTVEDRVIDCADRAVAVLWDTFKHPEKAIDVVAQGVQLNEFTPKQLNDLAQGRTTLSELRTPAQAESLETVLAGIVRKVMASAQEPAAE